MRRQLGLARQITTWTAAPVIAVLFTVVTTPVGAQQGTAAPLFKVDPSWPLDMPNHWIMGAVTGVFVDAKQHVWVTHLPETLTEEELYEEQKPRRWARAARRRPRCSSSISRASWSRVGVRAR